LLLSAGACRRYRSIAGTRSQRPQLSIDASCQQGAQQQTRRTPLLLSIDGKDTRTDERTDGRTLDRSINPALRMFAKKTAAGKHCVGMKYAYNFIFFLQQVCAEPRTSALDMTLPAAAALAPADIDRYLVPAPRLRQAGRCRSTGQVYIRTDRRTEIDPMRT